MALIRCEGCQAVIESTLEVCLGCGRCPGCGTRRLRDDQLAPNCPECGASQCIGCSRCHACGFRFESGLATCECGHPHDPEQLRRIEKLFAFSPQKSGCLAPLLVATLIPVLAVCLVVAVI